MTIMTAPSSPAMKNYTDTERFNAIVENTWTICKGMVGDMEGKFVVATVYDDSVSGWHPTPRAAIDEAMNREADRKANEQLKNMTGGSAV